MIITRAPFRISFVGGGSDLKSFYSHHEGAVLSATINKYIYISSHNFFDDDKIRIKYSQTETVGHFSEINHPIFNKVLEKFNISGALEITSNADIPSGSGLGSSSAFTVSLLHNMYVRKRQFVTKELLAQQACDIEINRLNEPIGKQDQYAASYGGLNLIRFYPSDLVTTEKIFLKSEILEKLENNLLMFFIGNIRNTSSVLNEQNQNMRSEIKRNILRKMVSLVDACKTSLFEDDLSSFGRILHENWMLKQELASKITSETLNSIYADGISAGAIGGKLLGAGSGGFLLFYCEPEKQSALRKKMFHFKELKFSFEHEGANLVYIGNEEYD